MQIDSPIFDDDLIQDDPQQFLFILERNPLQAAGDERCKFRQAVQGVGLLPFFGGHLRQ